MANWRYDEAVRWIRESLIEHKKAPGLLVGLSGTDSIVTFLACYDAMRAAGTPDRARGIHFAPSEDFVADHPEADTHLWFTKTIVPWLRERCPHATIAVNDSIDWRVDSLRWGALLDIATVHTTANGIRQRREPYDHYWPIGTRNRTEDTLGTYTKASMVAVAQPIIRIWKSEILDVCRDLGVPEAAITRSCEADCMCGRDELQARFVREIDALLRVRIGEALPETVEHLSRIRGGLDKWIDEQIKQNTFKQRIPYQPL